MECHEGATMIKTFRGLIADGGQDTIVLHSNDGSTGYRIVKLDLLPTLTGAINAELVLKIYSVAQTTVTAEVDFSDNTLLAVGYFKIHQDATTGSNEGSQNYAVIFDNMIFNQDIYVTAIDTVGANVTNYYLELEQMSLALDENTVATLKDIRNTARSIIV